MGFDVHIHVLPYKMKIWVKRVDELFSARPVNLTSTLCITKGVSKILIQHG
jgi:hypothetical protein